MSRDTFGTDDNEPVRHNDNHIYFITRAEFQNFREDVISRLDKLDPIVGKVDTICLYIENQTKAKNAMYRNIGIITGAINAIVLMILNAWKVVSGQ